MTSRITWRLHSTVLVDDLRTLIRIAEELQRRGLLYVIVPDADVESKTEIYRKILEKHHVDEIDDLTYMIELMRLCREAGVKYVRIYVAQRA
jgi:RNA-binding protein YhbY